MKKNIIILTIMFFLVAGTIYSADDIYLKIPVRIYKGSEYLKGLSKEDFSLKINGKVRSIEELLTGERSINDISERRNFILQFNLTDYGKNITKSINFFINEVLRKKDNLIVWTPVKVYRIRTDKPKQNIISDIEKIVKNDSFNYKRLKESARERLFSIVRKFNNFIPNVKDSNPYISSILNFLNEYSREWLDFKSKFLMPDIGKYYGVFSLLTQKYPGEKYFVNFQQREVIPSLKKYNNVKRDITNYLSNIAGTSESSYSSSIANALKKIDKSMLLSDNFDPEKLISPFKGANISYNLILFHSFRQSGEDSDSVSPDLEGILRNISRSTGGFSINTNDFVKGIESILKKSDNYYFIIYKFNGKKGEKKIEIEIGDKNAKLFYKKKFLPGEIDLLIKLASEPKITISEVKTKGHDLSFTISGFSITGEKKKTGIMKVEIKIIDKDRNSVMNKNNTLRAEKDSIKISLKITPELKGFFKLEITAKDMNANKTANFSKYIELK
ncbi:MAG: hypothetical protein KAS97_09330 [Candidatus Aminicenantes bacterium]|nr:hypothetical protein [Candidatus Aminicenantes bacterium]